MANDITIKGGHPISENLSTVTVGDVNTCLEISDKNGARVTGNLEVTGVIKGKTDIQLGYDITCDDITCDDITCDDIDAGSGTITTSGEISAGTLTCGGDFDMGGNDIEDVEKITSDDITIDSAADITLDAAGGDVNILQADLTIPVDKKVILGNTGEYIVGDDTDLDIVSSNDATISTGRDFIVDAAKGII